MGPGRGSRYRQSPTVLEDAGCSAGECAPDRLNPGNLPGSQVLVACGRAIRDKSGGESPALPRQGTDGTVAKRLTRNRVRPETGSEFLADRIVRDSAA